METGTHKSLERAPETMSGQSGSAGVIGNVVGRRAEEDENNTAAGWRTGVLYCSSGPVRYASGPVRLLVFDPGQVEPDIGAGIIDRVQVT